MKIGIILGTRPEIIKFSPMIKLCEKENLDYFIIHTNQHYSENMDKVFFEELNLPKPKYNLSIGSGSHGDQTGRMLIEIEKVLIQEKPDITLVQGDTNAVLAGSLASSKLGIKVGHVEAGLRSYDKTMPEEINRIVADHISDYLFCPTNKQRDILTSEGISKDKIFVVGNTIVDAVNQIKNILSTSILIKNDLIKKRYILLTMHRPSNVDNKEILEAHLKNISKLGKNKDLCIIFPIHPRTLKNIKDFNIKVPENIKVIDSQGFVDLLSLENYSKIILTDSGGIQEEACILKVPSLNLRENTERPECVEVGASKIVGSDFKRLNEGYDYFNSLASSDWPNPFGEGKTCEKIIRIINEDE
jgi:UDP-N-acetylglucosamine 2-epimerase (non-hydrolysing)